MQNTLAGSNYLIASPTFAASSGDVDKFYMRATFRKVVDKVGNKRRDVNNLLNAPSLSRRHFNETF